MTAALELFSEEGYRNTSTVKIAKRAHVSEALIFRHFKNKEGLLEAIVMEGETHEKELFSNIIVETDPKEVLRKTIRIGQTIDADQDAASYWKLNYKLKWELELYSEHKMQEVQNKLMEAFTALRYKNPQQEATLLLTSIDGMATRYFLQKSFDIDAFTNFLMIKYGL